MRVKASEKRKLKINCGLTSGTLPGLKPHHFCPLCSLQDYSCPDLMHVAMDLTAGQSLQVQAAFPWE